MDSNRWPCPSEPEKVHPPMHFFFTANKERTLSTALQTLLALQRLDDKLSEVDRRQQEIPRLRSSSDRELNQASETLASQKQRLQEAVTKQRTLEKTLQAAAEQVRKKEARKFEVKSNTEYKALLKEIEYTEKENSRTEDAILLLFEEIDSLKKAVSAQETVLQEKEEAVHLQAGRLDEEIGVLEKERVALQQERDAVCRHLEDDLLRRYEQVRKIRQGSAVVVVRGDVCPGCHLGVPPQTVNEVLQTGEVRNCPHCMRILYCVLPDEEAV